MPDSPVFTTHCFSCHELLPCTLGNDLLVDAQHCEEIWFCASCTALADHADASLAASQFKAYWVVKPA